MDKASASSSSATPPAPDTGHHHSHWSFGSLFHHHPKEGQHPPQHPSENPPEHPHHDDTIVTDEQLAHVRSHLSASCSEACDEATLKRFIRATGGNLPLVSAGDPTP